jgi:hypothetical protein
MENSGTQPSLKSTQPMMNEWEDADGDLMFALQKLEQTTHKNQFVSKFTAMLTFLHLLLVAFLVVGIGMLYFLVPALRIPLLLADLAVTVSAVLCVLTYDRQIRQGNAIYQEISDELEWRVHPTNKQDQVLESEEKTGDPPNLRVRIVLREFILSTRLPLVSSDNGPMIYTVLNVALFFLLIAFYYIIPG